MGIFSRFRKKEQQPSPPEDRESLDGWHGAPANRATLGDTLDQLSRATTIQRDIARATTLKIDAIESEMALEFVSTTQFGTTGNTIAPAASSEHQADSPPELVMPLVDLPAPPAAATDSAADANRVAPELPSAPAIEEAAILFANAQTALAEQILQAALQDEGLGAAAPVAWNMLFDLYQVTGQRAQFDALSIGFAGKFETSPPAWIDTPALAASQAADKTAIPSVAFAGVLNAQIGKQLARAQKLAESHPALRLEFVRVSAVDPVGCGLLLRILKKLQKAGLELVLVGAPQLADKIRAILAVGRRDETEAPWLLLLEILRLLNREQEFEESSIDYCVTFEVSPPAFSAPETRVTTAQEESAPDDSTQDAFVMPLLIEGDTRQLIGTITAFAAQHDPVILDCSQLARVDFSAAGQLLNGLASVAGKTVELHNVNHLVAALLHVLGMQHIARILPRKN